MSFRLQRLAAGLCLLSMGTSLVGCGGAAPAAGPSDTPEACFQSMQSSLHSGDFGGFVDCTTDQSQATMAGAMVMMGAMMKMMSSLASMGRARGGGGDANSKWRRSTRCSRSTALATTRFRRSRNKGGPMGIGGASRRRPGDDQDLPTSSTTSATSSPTCSTVMATIEVGNGAPRQESGRDGNDAVRNSSAMWWLTEIRQQRSSSAEDGGAERQ